MATFEITAPDGTKYEVTGTTQEGALAALKKYRAQQGLSDEIPAPAKGGGGAGVPQFDPEKFRAMKEGQSAYFMAGRPKPETQTQPQTESSTPAFDAFVARYHPDISAEEREAMKSRMSNPARYGDAAAGFMFPFADEVAAGIGAGIQGVGRLFTGEEGSMSEDYDKGLEHTRMFQAATDELQGGVDELIGGAAMFGGGGAVGMTRAGTALATGRTAAARYGKAAMLGAGGGAGYGFAEGEGGADRAEKAAWGGATGLVAGAMGNGVAEAIGAAARKFGPTVKRILGREGAITPEGGISPTAAAQLRTAGVDPDEVTAEFAEAFAKRAGDMPDDQAARAATLDSLNIPGTRGQLTGDVTQQAAEQGMRAGARGGQGAANVMRQFDETQAGAVDAARDAIGARMGGGRTLANDAMEASGRALQGVQRKADEAKAAAQVFYKQSDEAGVRIAPQAFDDLVVRIEDRLAAAEVIVDNATPMASRMLKVLQGRTIRPEGATGGVSLKLVDGTRSRISAALRDARRTGNTPEAEALSEILSGMDEWIDDAVEGALYQGGKEGLDSLKAARKLWTDYRKQFFGKKGADRFIAKMVEDEASPRDVFAWLYSNGRLGANRQSVQYAAKLKDILGEGSDEWAALRQGAWAKLTQGTGDARRPGYQKVGEDIVEFVTGETRQLARTMFSPQEIKEMLVYARAMRTLTPQRMATNPSGSGYEAGRLGQAALRRLSEMIGFSVGGIEGAIAGGAAGRVATGGGGWLRARAAAAGIQPRQSVIPGAMGGNLAAGSVEGEDVMRALQ